jgi:hypothetical protein
MEKVLLTYWNYIAEESWWCLVSINGITKTQVLGMYMFLHPDYNPTAENN